jgi:hypothetical protein
VQQLDVRLLPFGDVAGNLGESEQLAIRVVDGIDDDERPKPASVLPHPPSFRAETPGLAGDPERLFREPGRAILRGVERRKMLADDLAGPIALQSRRSRIPAYDHAIDVDHEDRVVDDGIDQELEALGVADFVKS